MATRMPATSHGRSPWLRELYAAFGLPAERVESFRLDIRPGSMVIVEVTLLAEDEAIGRVAEVARRYAVDLHELPEESE